MEISFKGTYKVTIKNPQKDMYNYLSYKALNDFCAYKGYYGARKYHHVDDTKNKFSAIEENIVVPKYEDELFEKYCFNRGIEFRKYKTRDLLDYYSLKLRIKEPKGDLSIVELDCSQIDAYLDKTLDDYENLYRIYHDEKQRQAMGYVQCGAQFPLATLELNQDNEAKFDDNFPIYFLLIDLGYNKIPVYMDDASIKCAKQLNLIASDTDINSV